MSTDVDELMTAVRQGRARVNSRTTAIALILHGGRAINMQPQRFKDVSYLRMLPFAPAIVTASRGRIAPVLVHNTHGGWVAESGSGIVQARELITRLRSEHDLPIVLLGHSSGGWVALRAARYDGVAGAVALAPWVSDDQPTEGLHDKVIRVIHGARDTVCSPEKSRAFVDRLRAEGVDATYTSVPRGNHALLDNPGAWHRRAARAVVEIAAAH